MGTWGPGPLENDDAQAFLIESGERIDLARCMVAAFNKVIQNGDEYLEAPSAQIAIAAAQTLFLNLSDTNEGSRETSQLFRHTDFSELVDLSQRALKRVLTPPSELLELWQESNEFVFWKNKVSDISSKLRKFEI